MCTEELFPVGPDEEHTHLAMIPCLELRFETYVSQFLIPLMCAMFGTPVS